MYTKQKRFDQNPNMNIEFGIWVIDQAWDQDGWILAKFFFRVFMDWDGVKVH